MKTLIVLSGLVLSLAAKTAFGAGILSEPLLYVDGAPAVQGSEFNLFIRPTTDYLNSYVVLDASLDGNAVSLEHPVKDMWVFHQSQFESLKHHALTFTVSLENAGQADQLTQALCEAGSQISNLQNQIAATTDPNQLAQLNALLAQKQALQTQLTTDLTNLKNAIGIQTYSFAVAPAPSGSTVFPSITAVAPNVGSLAGGTAISITGTNFVAGATVSVGGVAATNVVVASATSITATTAAFTTPGVQDVVVTLPLASGDVEQKQALLPAGFFVTNTRSEVHSLLASKHFSPLHGGPGFEHDHMCAGSRE